MSKRVSAIEEYEQGAGVVSLYQYFLYKYPTVASLAQLHEQLKYEGPHNVAAIIVESITGTNGIVRPPKGYLEACAHVLCCVHLYYKLILYGEPT